MTPKEKLLDLISTRFKGSQAAFARAIKRSPSQVNQWISGYRNLDVKACRHIEKTLDLPIDYFLTSDCQTTTLRACEPTPIVYHQRFEHSAIAMEIAELTDSMSRDGQLMLLGQAKLIAATHPRDKVNCCIIKMSEWRERIMQADLVF